MLIFILLGSLFEAVTKHEFEPKLGGGLVSTNRKKVAEPGKVVAESRKIAAESRKVAAEPKKVASKLGKVVAVVSLVDRFGC